MQTPHSYRRQSIHGLFLILIGFIVLILAFSCRTQKTGCESLYYKKKRFTAYLKNMVTDSIYILSKEGAILCSFKQNKK